MVSPPELEIPSAIVLNGTEQPQSASAEPGSYNTTSSSSNGSGLGLALGAPSSSSPSNGGLDAPSQSGAADGSHSRLASRRASFQRWAYENTYYDSTVLCLLMLYLYPQQRTLRDGTA
jgi:hypothetical protein